MKLENFILHIVNPDPRAVKNDARLKKFLESRKMIEKWGLGDAAFQEPIDADLIRLFLRYLSAAQDVEVHPERRSKDGVVLLEALKGRNELINKTLGAWNRALGHAGAANDKDELQKKIAALEKLLAEA